LYALLNGMPEEIAANAKLVKAFEVAMENRLELRRREFKGESVNGRPPGEMAFGIVQQGMTAASLRNANDCGVILDYLANSYWNPNLVTTHNPKAIFNTDLSGGLPALIIRMLADSQPGWVELLPAWPENLPAGRIEGVKLRSQIELKELSWNGENISAILLSPVSQQIELRSQSQIQSLKSSKKSAVELSNGKYAIVLPANQAVSLQLKVKQN
jgi:alpha-L-fucosidase 2